MNNYNNKNIKREIKEEKKNKRKIILNIHLSNNL
jgi:hypothetical protein